MRMIDADTLIDLINRVEMRYDISGDPPQETREQIFAHAWGMYKAIIEEMIYDQPTLTQPNEWVSVEERLPEEKQRVIVRCERVGTSVGWILWSNWMTDIGPGAGKVTHWMPLPAPPDSQKKGEK